MRKLLAAVCTRLDVAVLVSAVFSVACTCRSWRSRGHRSQRQWARTLRRFSITFSEFRLYVCLFPYVPHSTTSSRELLLHVICCLATLFCVHVGTLSIGRATMSDERARCFARRLQSLNTNCYAILRLRWGIPAVQSINPCTIHYLICSLYRGS